MKKLPILVPILLLAALALVGCGGSPEVLNNQGNEAFAEQNYDGALAAYLQAQEDAPDLAEPYYNAANTRYRQSDYEAAQQQIEQALLGEEAQAGLDQHSYYNLGNAFFQAGQYKAAIEAYKEALRLNPGDLEAKQNLELALRQLQQEQQQDQQQQDQDQEQQQDQQQQDGRQENQDQQDQSQDDAQQQDAGQQEGQQDQPQDDAQQQDPQQEDQRDPADPQQGEDESESGGQPDQVTGLSKEQAEQLLEAAAEGTQSLEEFLQQILVFPGASPAEDW